MKEAISRRDISVTGENDYKEIVAYLGQTAFGSMVSLNQKTRIYYLNEEQDKIITMNDEKKTIGFSDRVGQDIIDIIKDMNHKQKIKGGCYG